MAKRTLPGLALTGFWPLNTKYWNTEMDANLRLLSAVSRLVVDSITAALPGSPADGVITVDPASGAAGTIKVRDEGAWVDVAPSVGWRTYVKDVNRLASYTATGWVLDVQTVNLTGNQTISNTKTFSTSPLVPTVALGDNTTKAASMAALLAAFAARGLTTAIATQDANAIVSPGTYSLGTLASGAVGGPTDLGVAYTILHVGTGSGGFQLASPQTSIAASKKRLWHRQMFGSTWSAWEEFADLASPVFTGTLQYAQMSNRGDDATLVPISGGANITPAVRLSALAANAAGTLAIQAYQYSSTHFGPTLSFTRSRGAPGAHAQNTVGLSSMTILASASDGAAYQQIARFDAYNTAATTGTSSPGEYRFSTTRPGAILPALSMTITDSGGVSVVGDGAIGGKLSVGGPVQIAQYTLATLPSASANNRGLIEVTDATGGSKTCKSNGTVWQILNTTTTVS